MGILTGFYKKLMVFSLFRKKAKARLCQSVKSMDAIVPVSAAKQAWLQNASAESRNFKLKHGLYKADLMRNNEVLPECQLFMLLDIIDEHTFICHRHFLFDDLNDYKSWEGTYAIKGNHIHFEVSSVFYFEDSVITSDGHGNVIFSINPGYGPNILFKFLNKAETQAYRSKSSD